MNPFPLLVLLLQLPPACVSLPAPVNLRITSLNFQYELHWEPGPGSPPGTIFWVSKRVTGKKKWKELLGPTNATSYRLELELRRAYDLAVKAKYNHSMSPLSSSITFDPLTQTEVGPPTLSWVGYGTWIQVNISHPNIQVIQVNYAPMYKMLWRKEKKGEIQKLEKMERSFNVSNLEQDMEYCFQGWILTRTIKDIPPSEWSCGFSSAPEPDNRMLVLLVATVLLIALIVLLTTGIFCLHYTGFLCKLKDMPASLMFVLWPDYVFAPKTTVLDQVTILPQTVKQRNHPTTSAPSSGENNSEDEEADEEDEVKLYVNRNADGGSQQDPEYTSGYLGKDARGSTGVTEEPPAEVESHHCENKAGTVHDPDQTGLQEEEVRTETRDFSEDINLFSVTLASMATCDEGDAEEEQDSESSSTDFLRIYTLNPLSRTDSLREAEDQVSASLMETSEEILTESGNTDCWMDEEEEEISGYLTHR